MFFSFTDLFSWCAYTHVGLNAAEKNVNEKRGPIREWVYTRDFTILCQKTKLSKFFIKL